MMVKVAVFGDAEHRKTEQELATAKETASAIHERYSATGTIKCPGTEGSAQVTFKNNIITTADHVFWGKNCEKIASPSECKLVLKSLSGAEQTLEMEDYAPASHGYPCPGTKPNDDQDWAVIKLKGNARGVQPYAVEELPGKLLAKGSAVTFVAHSIDFLRKDQTGKVYEPKHIQRGCHINDFVTSVWDPNVVTMYKGDCDAAGHASGGSILVEGANGPLLSAIFVSSHETKALEKNIVELDSDGYATGRVTPNIHPYNAHSWSAVYVPVTGNFLKAIRSAN
jgi:hypothetical protein